jgi:hypothetical protein
MCLDSVKQWGWTLEYVPDALKTEALCIEAMKHSDEAIKFVPKNMKSAVKKKSE